MIPKPEPPKQDRALHQAPKTGPKSALAGGGAFVPRISPWAHTVVPLESLQVAAAVGAPTTPAIPNTTKQAGTVRCGCIRMITPSRTTSMHPRDIMGTMGRKKSVFITGAAAGIGRATALSFARNGYLVGAYDVDEAGLASLAAEIGTTGATAVTGHLDVTDADETARRVTEFAEAAGHRLDVMINNAGILIAGNFEEIPVAAHHREIDVNTKGVVNGLHAAFPHLKSTPGSVVVNLASASAIYGQPELATYSATKFFVRAITEALDIEWSRHGIRVVAMWPLYVQTAMTDDIRTGTTDSLGIRLTAQDIADDIIKAVDPPLPRKLIHQVHFPVGRQAKAMAMGARFSPAWLTRLANKRLAGS
jgi:NADP-dependent 3-hydroxy acid dehydrogenase YdfG